MNEDVIIETSVHVSEVKPLFNPFPGLRPFSIEESHLFFGREGQSDEVLENLAENKFVAVIGASGSGKSSLMYCGLVPILHGGFITNAGSLWKIIATRPGNGPIFNLAESIAKNTRTEKSGSDLKLDTAILDSILRSSSLGLVEAIKNLKRPANENILLLVDQFEELFRYKRRLSDGESFNESYAFVKLLVEAVRQSEVPIYIVLTMRSDFIGECAQYQDLTKLINDSHYLIPQMTRDNLKTAITGPIAVGGGLISPRLLHQLLNDVGDNPDQLPILQHALMRTWNYWEKYRKGNEPLDISHYEAIGRMEKALSEHANEAYDELSLRGKEICEHLFKSLTERGADNRGIRRPSSVREMCDISIATFEEVKEVIEVFRKPGRSFLSPSTEFALQVDTVIDISHESLMRIWDKLKVWVAEEASAVQMYLRLSEASALYQEGKSGLWRPPDLHLATSWKEKQKPTLAWALRYNPAFERAMVYLETSEKEYKAEEENKIRLQKRAIKRSRNVAIVLGMAAIFSLAATIFAFIKQMDARSKEQIAYQKQVEADTQKGLAEKSSLEAERRKKEAEMQRLEAEKQREHAEEQKLMAEFSEKEARRQSALALQKSIETNQQRAIAEQNSKEALAQKENAERARNQANKLRMLSISQSMAVKSLQIEEDVNQKALLAYHAFRFNEDYEGNKFNDDIYNGLYYSIKQYPQNRFRFLGGHEDAVRAIAFEPNSGKFYTAGSDGLILKWQLSENTEAPQPFKRESGGFRAIAVSSDGAYLACGKDDGTVEVIYTRNSEKTTKTIKLHNGEVNAVLFSRDNKYVYTAGADSTIRIWNFIQNESWVLARTIDRVKDMAISDNEKKLAVALQDNGIAIWDIPVPSKNTALFNLQQINTKSTSSIQTLIFDRSSSYIITGDKVGIVVVWDAKQGKELFKLRGHKARISDLQFNPDGTILASASFDGTVRLWQTIDFNKEPIVLKDHESWVYAICFTPDGSSLISGCSDSRIKEWLVSSSLLAKEVKKKIERNLTQKEWNQYIGEDIKYEKAKTELP